MLGPNHYRNSEEKLIASIAFEDCIIKSLTTYLEFYRTMGRDGPLAIFLSFLGVRGYTMTQSAAFFGSGRRIERDDLILPEILVEDIVENPTQILRPAFDMVWQACGHRQSLNYDEDGEWSPKK